MGIAVNILRLGFFMKKLLLLSALTIALLNSTHGFAAEKTSKQASDSKNSSAISPITVNQRIGSWDIHCAYPNAAEQNNKTVSQGCIAQQNLLTKGPNNSQSPIASLLLEKVKQSNDLSKPVPFQFTVVVPLGFSLQSPANLTFDRAKPVELPWAACTTNGCIATKAIDNDLQQLLTKNKLAHLVIHRVNGTTLTINFNIDNVPSILKTMDEMVNKKNP